MNELSNLYASAQLGSPMFSEKTSKEAVTDWGVHVVMAPLAWKKVKGQGIKVAILDTGIDKNHPDLKENLKGGINFTTANRNDWDDRQGHGTHVAGIIAGSDNNIGVVGIAPKAELYAVKVLADNGAGSLEWIAQGIDWCIQNEIDVINMSLGTEQEPPKAFHEIIKKAYQAGIPMIVASGNENQHVGWPAAYPETIAVAAISSALEKAEFSNYGPETDLIAPGVDIYSTYAHGRYAKLSGTSMASPVVAGAVALMIAEAKKHNVGIPIYEYRLRLRNASVDLGDRGHDEQFGAGLLNLSRLLR